MNAALFEQLQIDNTLEQAEKDAIDKLVIDDTTTKDLLREALKNEKIPGIGQSFLGIANAFALYNVRWEGTKLICDAQDANYMTTPSWIQDLISDPDDNDFAYLMYKLATLRGTDTTGLDTLKFNIETSTKLKALKQEILQTETTPEANTNQEDETSHNETGSEVLSADQINFSLYSGIGAQDIVDAWEELHNSNPTLAETILPLLQEGKIQALQLELGMTTDATSINAKADGLFGKRTLENLRAGEVVGSVTVREMGNETITTTRPTTQATENNTTNNYPNLDSIEGFTGKGTYTRDNGDSYTGEFKDGKVEGKGTYIRDDGTIYTGEFKDSKKEGKGTYTRNDGSSYTGDFKDDQFEGKGTYKTNSGKKYTGNWKDDKFEATLNNREIWVTINDIDEFDKTFYKTGQIKDATDNVESTTTINKESVLSQNTLNTTNRYADFLTLYGKSFADKLISTYKVLKQDGTFTNRNTAFLDQKGGKIAVRYYPERGTKTDKAVGALIWIDITSIQNENKNLNHQKFVSKIYEGINVKEKINKQIALEKSIIEGIDRVSIDKFDTKIQSYLAQNNRTYRFAAGPAYTSTIDFRPGKNNGNGMEIVTEKGERKLKVTFTGKGKHAFYPLKEISTNNQFDEKKFVKELTDNPLKKQASEQPT